MTTPATSEDGIDLRGQGKRVNKIHLPNFINMKITFTGRILEVNNDEQTLVLTDGTGDTVKVVVGTEDIPVTLAVFDGGPGETRLAAVGQVVEITGIARDAETISFVRGMDMGTLSLKVASDAITLMHDPRFSSAF